MATLSKLSIYLGLDSSGMTLGVTEAAKQLAKLKEVGDSVFNETRTPFEQFNNKIRNLNDLLRAGAINWDTYKRAVRLANKELSSARWWNRMFGGTAAKITAIAASFLTVEKILGRIRSIFANGDRIQKLMPEADSQPLIAMVKLWQQVNEQIDKAFLQLVNSVAPTIITIVENTRLLLEPLIAATGILDSFTAGIDFLAARWADLQAILSGSVQTIAAEYMAMWAGIKLGFFEVVAAIESVTGQDFGAKLGIDAAMNEIKTAFDLAKGGVEKYFEGMDGRAGGKYLEQVEKKRRELEMGSLKWSDIYDQKAEKSASKLKGIIKDIAPPGAFERGTSAAVSAINNVQRQQEQKLLKAAEKTAVDVAALRKAIQDTYPGVVIL